MSNDHYEGEWDFDGGCLEGYGCFKSASIRFFQWTSKYGGKEWKPGRAQFRLSAKFGNYDLLRATGRVWCNQMNNGVDPQEFFQGRKSTALK